MSREIKFRAWDKILKRTLDYGEIRSLELKGDIALHTFLNREYENLIPMQYTGLHDRNGKEIYEGDITHCTISSADWTHFTRDYTAIVEQDICNPCFVLKQENGHVEYDFVMCDLMILEVIGNIYEHPHLLGEKGEGQG